MLIAICFIKIWCLELNVGFHQDLYCLCEQKYKKVAVRMLYYHNLCPFYFLTYALLLVYTYQFTEQVSQDGPVVVGFNHGEQWR